jgi:anti-sigma factor RsiW
MDRTTEKQLLRLLAGELSATDAGQWRQRLENEGDVRRAFASLRETWEVLEPPPLPKVHPSFTSRVVRRAVDRPVVDAAVPSRPSPAWAVATAALALVGGILVGVVLASPSESEDWTAWDTVELTQAEAYWEALGQSPDGFSEEGVR